MSRLARAFFPVEYSFCGGVDCDVLHSFGYRAHKKYMFLVKINKTLVCAKGMTQKKVTVMMSTTLLSIHTKYLAQNLCKKSDDYICFKKS
jgi:hypothetical protein